eukprot:5275351-Lingulodinium_polyedra.AAC.1
MHLPNANAHGGGSSTQGTNARRCIANPLSAHNQQRAGSIIHYSTTNGRSKKNCGCVGPWAGNSYFDPATHARSRP